MEDYTEGYVFCEISGKIVAVLWGRYVTDPDNNEFWNYFEFKKTIAGTVPESIFSDRNRIYEGEEKNGGWMDEYHVVPISDKKRILKFCLGGNTIYRAFNIEGL